MAQVSTITALARAQGTAIAAARYVQEHNAVANKFAEKMMLEKGDKERVVPKIGQAVMRRVGEGEDIVDEQSIGMSNVTLTASEIGAKFIVTKQLIDQNGTTDIFKMIGRMFGEAAARVLDTDTHALYSGLNGGTVYGAAAATMSLGNFAAAIAKGRGKALNPFKATYAIQHPHAVMSVATSATAIGASSAGNLQPKRVSDSMSDAFLKNFYKVSFNGCSLYEDGNLSVDSSSDSIGVIAQEDALVTLWAKQWETWREEDPSRRAWEVGHWARYDVFELDDTKGAPMTYASDVPNDTA
jgi:hypothetical protein